MVRLTLTAIALALPLLAGAKLPPPDDAAKAKAAEAAAKTAWQAKVDAYQLCKVQDRIAGAYKKGGAVKVAIAAPKPPASAASSSSAATPIAVPPAAATGPKTPASSPTASQGGGTPVADVGTPTVAVPACADPGPFAYNPPSQTPLETSEAHSPAGNATKPPSVNAQSAEMAPAKAASGK